MQSKLPPANRLVAFVGPYISLLSGAVASWLVVHVEILGSLHLGQDKLANGLAYAVTAALGAGLPHLGMQKWLAGHQQYVGKLFTFVENLDPQLQREVGAALPMFNGDVLKSLQHVGGPMVSGTTASVSNGLGHIDTSGDVEKPNELIDVQAPLTDMLPLPEAFGNDAVHAPPAAPAAGTEAGVVQ